MIPYGWPIGAGGTDVFDGGNVPLWNISILIASG
jgi:hypothetical protein